MPVEQATGHPSELLPFIDEDPTCGPPLEVDPLPRERAEALARNLKGISDPTRLQILSVLLAAPEGEACVCDLTPLLGLAQSTVSQHMKMLVDSRPGEPQEARYMGLVRGHARAACRTRRSDLGRCGDSGRERRNPRVGHGGDMAYSGARWD